MDILTAIILISGLPGTPEPQPTEADFYVLQASVHKFAVSMEIMDEREKLWIFSKPCDFQKDLDLLRDRAKNLNGAPMVADALRFPNRQQINHMVDINRQRRNEYSSRSEIELDRVDNFNVEIGDLDARYRILDACRDAQSDAYYVYMRRIYLKALKQQLDAEEWAMGILPPPTND